MKFTKTDYSKMLRAFKNQSDYTPDIAILLTDELSSFADFVDKSMVIPYSSIPCLPLSSNPLSHNRFILSSYHGINVLLLEGIVHYYEGYDPEDVGAIINLLKLLNTKLLILTDTVQAINEGFQIGDLMLLTDHISTFVPSPLRGNDIQSVRAKGANLHQPYDLKLSEEIYRKAKIANLPVKKGTYLQYPGLQKPTKAELQVAKILNADCIGLSTALEALVSSYLSIKTIAFSLVKENCEKNDEEINANTVKSAFKLLDICIREGING